MAETDECEFFRRSNFLESVMKMYLVEDYRTLWCVTAVDDDACVEQIAKYRIEEWDQEWLDDDDRAALLKCVKKAQTFILDSWGPEVVSRVVIEHTDNY